MTILAECPICRKKQSVKRKKCGCGENLDKAKQSQRVKYWISYRIPDGKDEDGKVKYRQKRESVDAFEDLNGYSIEDARKAHSKRVVQKAENRIMDILPDSKMTFQGLSDWYLGLEKVKGMASYKTAKTYLKKFNQEFGHIVISQIKPADLENHQEKRKKEGLKPKTIDDEIDYIQTVVIKAFDNDLVSGDSLKPFRKVKRLLSGKKRGTNARKRTLTRQEVNTLKKAANEVHTVDLLNLGDWTGMRAGEIKKLRFKMVDLQRRIIALPEDITKEGKEKRVPIGKRVYEILTRDNRNIRKAGEVDHVITYSGKPIGNRFVTGLKTAAEKTGITWGREVEGGWIFHDLRRTFKTDMRKAGVHKSVIDAIVGHTSNDMDSRYNVVDDEDLLQAIRMLETYREKLANVDHSVDQAGKIDNKETLKGNNNRHYENINSQ